MASHTTFPTNDTTKLPLYRYLATLPDPRYRRARRHLLMTILFIALCATLSGADSFFQMAQWAHVKRAGLEKYVDLSAGIPRHDITPM